MLLGFQASRIVDNVAVENLARMEAAAHLESELLEQKGYVTAYVLSGGDRKWLTELAEKQPVFSEWLARAREGAQTFHDKSILATLEQACQQYQEKRAEAIALFDEGEPQRASELLLNDVVPLNERAHHLCESFIQSVREQVMDRSDAASHQVATLTGAAVICVALFVVFSVILLHLFFNRLFTPLRDLTSRARSLAADRYGISPEVPTDELKALHYYMTQIVTAFTDADTRRESNGISSSINDDSATSLAAAVAHEIRSPLTAMKMLLFSLQKSVSDTPSLQNKLAVLAREVTRLEAMSRGFLAVSRPAEPRCAPHQLSVLVQQVADLFQHSLESRGIRLQTHLEPDLPLIGADAAHVTQVIVNLLTNALEASRDGGTIWLSATQACGDEGAARVILRIRDEGAGVPSEAAARVFEPYFTTKARGTGLGLAIAKSLISRYSGKLVLESSSAEGSTFSVWIPATPACHG